MTFEEYKQKKKKELEAFQKYKESKGIAKKKVEPVKEVPQTVKVSTEKPSLPTIKVGQAEPQTVKVQPKTELQKTAQRIATSAKPKSSDILSLGAGPLATDVARAVSVKVAETPVLKEKEIGVGETILRRLKSDIIVGNQKILPIYGKMLIEQGIKPVSQAVKTLSGVAPITPVAPITQALQPLNKDIIKKSELIDKKINNYAKSEIKKIGIDIDKISSDVIGNLNKRIDNLNKQQEMLLAPIQDDKPGLSSVNEYVSAITGGGASMLTALGITAVTKNPNLAVLFLTAAESSDIYNQAREKGKSPEESMKLAIASGSVTALLEKVGLNAVLGKQGGRFLTSLASKGKLSQMAVGGVTETSTEILQTWWQNLVKKLGYEESQKVFEGTWETVVASLPVSLLASGVSQQQIDLIKDIEVEKLKQKGLSEEEANKAIDAMLRIRKNMADVMKDNPEAIIGRDIETFKKSVETKQEKPIEVPQEVPVKPQEAITEVLEPKTTKVSPKPKTEQIKAEDPLIQEAKKYKSAEEFVEAQGTPVYHGTDVADIVEKEGFKKMPIKTGVSAFGEGSYFTNKIGNAKGYGDVVKAFLKKDIKLKKVFDSDAYKVDTQKLIKEGYDGTIMETGNGQNIVVFDNSNIKTKSQLTDIWNKAQETKTEKPVKTLKKPIKKEIKKPVKKTESPVIKRVNSLFSEAEKLNPNLDTTSHKEQLKLAEKKIKENPQKAYQEAMSESTGKTLKTTLLGSFLEIGKQKNDLSAVANTATALAEHARRSGQEIEMIKATMEGDPTNRLLYRMAETKLKQIEAKYKTKVEGKDVDVVSRNKKQTKNELKKKTDFDVKDAQKLLDKIMCPY